MSQQQIIESLAIDASAVVAVLNDLEGDGLVVRTRDPADRRRHIVAITKLGEKTARQIEHAVVEAERETFASLTEAEAEQLHALLSRLSIQSACTVDTSCTE
jgi:DNA-binding MarR family transcriptional regulator